MSCNSLCLEEKSALQSWSNTVWITCGWCKKKKNNYHFSSVNTLLQSGSCCLWLGSRVSLVLCKHSVSPGSSLANSAHCSFTEAPWRYLSGCGTPGTGRAYGTFVTNKITVRRKQGTCERPDGLMVWFSYCSISPLQLHRKSLIISSYTGLLSLFRSLPHPLLWKLKFIFVTT